MWFTKTEYLFKASLLVRTFWWVVIPNGTLTSCVKAEGPFVVFRGHTFCRLLRHTWQNWQLWLGVFQLCYITHPRKQVSCRTKQQHLCITGDTFLNAIFNACNLHFFPLPNYLRNWSFTPRYKLVKPFFDQMSMVWWIFDKAPIISSKSNYLASIARILTSSAAWFRPGTTCFGVTSCM